MKGDRKRGFRRNAAPADCVGAAAPLHRTHVDCPTRTECCTLACEEINVAYFIDHFVIDRARTVAETDLCPQIEMNLTTAIGGLASECQAGPPEVEGEGPFDFGPDRPVTRAAELR